MNRGHETDTFITPEELQEWLKIKRTKCYELLGRKEIPSYKVGRLRRIKKADVLQWLESQKE